MPQEKLSLQEKIELVLICGERFHSSREAADIFNARYPNKNIHGSTVLRILNKFKATGSLENRYKIPHSKPVTNEEGTFNVLLSVTENPRMALSERQEQTGISEKSIRRILKNNKFRAYKPKFIHTLLDRDFDARLDFSLWFQGMIGLCQHFHTNILFTDEATFTSNGTVSSQNCRWWADENPNWKIEAKSQFSFKTNVWCGILDTQIVGPYFFRGNLTSRNYLVFLNNEFFDFLHGLPLQRRNDIFFQQDGASVHSTLEVRAWLNEHFPHKWIGRYSENPWPARSPDLTPLDFFLWGYLKSRVYKHRPFRNIDHLEEVIRQCINNITPQMLRNVSREMKSRTTTCIERQGRHVE